MGSSDVVVESVIRSGITLAILLLAVPLGFYLGIGTISAFTQDHVSGVLALLGSSAAVAMVGLGLYIVAEGAVPSPLRRYVLGRLSR